MKATHPYPGAPAASGTGTGAVILALAAVLFGSVSAYFALRAEPSAQASVEEAAAVHPSFAQFQEQARAQMEDTEPPVAQEPVAQEPGAPGQKGPVKQKPPAAAAKGAVTPTAPASAPATRKPAPPAEQPAAAKNSPAPKPAPAPKVAPKPVVKAEPAPESKTAAVPKTKNKTSTLLGDVTVEELSKPEPPAFRRTVPNVRAEEPSAPRAASTPAASVSEVPTAAPRGKAEPPARPAADASAAPRPSTPLPKANASGAASEVVVPVKAEPLVAVPFEPKVLSATSEKVWVQVDATRTEIFEKGSKVPGLGVFQGQDDKGTARFGR